ncbi:MAG: uracil-DNA glycosylase family protein [Pseudomonadota bacterium]
MSMTRRAAAATETSLAGAIGACRICSERFAGTATGHQPRPVVRLSTTAPVLIAGQAPGMRVHKSGLPFDDPSGDRLRAWMGLGRDVFYDTAQIAMVPMAFCFPGYDDRGSDLPPPKICAKTWRDRAVAAVPAAELVLVIGQYAQAWHLGSRRRATLTETVRDWRALTREGLLPLPHPSWRNTAWLKRNPWFEEEVLPWLRAEIARLLA